VGPLLGAYLFVLAAGLPFAFDAATFVVGAALIASIRRSRAAHPTPDRPRLRREMAEGIRWLFAHPGLRMIAIAICVMNITLGSVLAILVLYVRDRLGQGAVWYGVLARGFGLTAPFWVAAAAVAVVAILAWHLFTPGRLATEAGSSVNHAENGSSGVRQGEKPESR
jgi:Transmembrane secretion effector